MEYLDVYIRIQAAIINIFSRDLLGELMVGY